MDNLYQLVAEHMADLSLPAAVHTVPSQTNYAWYWAYLDLKGKERFGIHFRLRPEDHPVVIRLLVWFLRDADAADAYQIRLDAGLLLAGPVGCGKTTLMKLCAGLLPADRRPWFKPCRELSLEVETDGPATILSYTRHSFDYAHGQPRTYCFDDLGLERTVNYYGTPINPMADILLSRYDYYCSHQMQTLITTNLNSTQIENLYGLRVRSRLREMMNLVAFPSEAPDKR